MARAIKKVTNIPFANALRVVTPYCIDLKVKHFNIDPRNLLFLISENEDSFKISEEAISDILIIELNKLFFKYNHSVALREFRDDELEKIVNQTREYLDNKYSKEDILSILSKINEKDE